MKISILTPSFNSGKYLQRAIDSVLNQECDNWEHIVVDGGSEDGTVDILKKNNHIIWISEPDRGQSDAMNKAFKMSEGDILGYLNADDEYQEGAFSKVIQFFNDNPNVDFLTGTVNRIYSEYEKYHGPRKQLMSILNLRPLTFPLNPVCYFYRRKVQEQIGEFPLENHFTMDYWFLLRVYRDYKPTVVDTVFGNYYYENNKSSDAKRSRISLRKVRNAFLYENPAVAFKYFGTQLYRICEKIILQFTNKLIGLLRISN